MKPSQRLRLKKILAHGFMLVALALVVLPFLMVVVASLRKGNFPPNSLWLNPDQWSLEHWKYVLNIPYSEIVTRAPARPGWFNLRPRRCTGFGIQ